MQTVQSHAYYGNLHMWWSHSGALEKETAASRITRTLQRRIDTRRRKAMTPGSRGNEEAMKQLENSLSSLEPHLNTLATEVLR